MSAHLTGVVIAGNEAANIEDCLRSLSFCDERILVDSFSDDDTVERARPHAEHIYRRSFRSHADQKNWALDQVEGPWALLLDADERIPPELAAEIRELCAKGEHDAYWIHRRNRFFGRWIRGAGWQRDRVLRLLRRDAGRYPEQMVHEEILLQAGRSAGRCEHRMLHLSYQDWPSTFSRLLSYTTRGARDREMRGKKGRARRVVLSPSARFLRQYFLQAGWRDGFHGFVLCTWAAIGVFLRELKLAVGETGRGAPDPALGGPSRVECVEGRPPRGADDPEEGPERTSPREEDA